MRGWLDYLVAGSPWVPVRGRAPERIARPKVWTFPTVITPSLLALVFLVQVAEDGWRGWMARAGLGILFLTVLDSFRALALHRTAVTLPPGEDDVLLTGVAGRRGRARRSLRKVLGVNLRQSVALARSVSRPSSEPVRLVRGTQHEAAESLAGRLRDGGLTVEVVPTPSDQIVASFRA